MIQLANAPAAHFDLEAFQAVAQRELAVCPLVSPGVCLNPTCSGHFAPRRPWQKYCSPACRKADEAEMRQIGQRAAPALLAWRMGKYETSDAPLRDLSRAGRNYIGHLQSGWLRSRQARAVQAQEKGER